jgi:hypothetical protein
MNFDMSQLLDHVLLPHVCRRSITDRVYRPRQSRGDESSQGGDDASPSLDEVHLALIKGISGPLPQQVCVHSENGQVCAQSENGQVCEQSEIVRMCIECNSEVQAE